MPLTISKAHARRLVLLAQGLAGREPFGKSATGALKAIEHLGYVQIDTISVVERAHHHIFWSRVGDYKTDFLSQLQGSGAVFEYWSHAASYLPMRDFRYSLPRKLAFADGKRHWFERDLKAMQLVLDRITVEGPLRAKDFESAQENKSGPWFAWKPEKKALEQLFIEGKLMVRERRGFQKVYDIPERVLPAGVDTSMPTPKEHARFRIRQFLRAQGIGVESEMRYLQRGSQSDLMPAVLELLKTGEIAPVFIEGIPDETYFAHPDAITQAAASMTQANPVLHVLSPFDNLVIQRARLKRLFEFDYQIECYVPEPLRKFGYFTLPLLWKDELIGRLDAKADRSLKKLMVHGVFLEPRFKPTPEFRSQLKVRLQEFATFNGCEKVSMPRNSRVLGAKKIASHKSTSERV